MELLSADQLLAAAVLGLFNRSDQGYGPGPAHTRRIQEGRDPRPAAYISTARLNALLGALERAHPGALDAYLNGSPPGRAVK
ncbi:hypothetical protein [Tessaracoccus sp.]